MKWYATHIIYDNKRSKKKEIMARNKIIKIVKYMDPNHDASPSFAMVNEVWIVC